MQGGRDTDALFRLVVLQDGGYDTRQGKSRAVERMAKGDFLVLCTAVTAMETVRLVGVKIGYVKRG